MFSVHWSTRGSLLILMLCAAGCAFPGRQTAQNQGGLFGKQDTGYLNPADSEAVEEEPQPKKGRNPEALKLSYAQWMEETGNLPVAQQSYAEVVKQQPKNVPAILGLARTQFSTGRIDQAEQGFQRALKLDRESPQAHSGLGQCYAARKQWPQAVESLSKAVQGLPEDKKIRHELAIALVHTGNTPEAQLQFTQSVGAAAGHYNTALILKDTGHLPEAEEHLGLALHKDPKMRDAERWLAEIRRMRQGGGQAIVDAPSTVNPRVTHTAYRDYGEIGTSEIVPAVYLPDHTTSATVHAEGHSAAVPASR